MKKTEEIMNLTECDYVLKQDLKRAIEKPLAKYNKAEKGIKKLFPFIIALIIIGAVFMKEISIFIASIF